MQIKPTTEKSISYIPIDLRMELIGETSKIAKSNNKAGFYQIFSSDSGTVFLAKQEAKLKETIEKTTDHIINELFTKCNFTEYGYFKNKLPLILINTPIKETIESLIPKLATGINKNTKEKSSFEPKFLYHHLNDSSKLEEFRLCEFIWYASLPVRASQYNHLLILSTNKIEKEQGFAFHLVSESLANRAIIITKDKDGFDSIGGNNNSKDMSTLTYKIDATQKSY